MSTYNIVLSTNESTVVTEYEPQTKRSDSYQSEAAFSKARLPMPMRVLWKRLEKFRKTMCRI